MNFTYSEPRSEELNAKRINVKNAISCVFNSSNDLFCIHFFSCTAQCYKIGLVRLVDRTFKISKTWLDFLSQLITM